jgi:predicted dehydrogenase
MIRAAIVGLGRWGRNLVAAVQDRSARLRFEPADALHLELEAFADAIEGRAPYLIPPVQMIEVIAALEAICRSMAAGAPVALEAPVAA